MALLFFFKIHHPLQSLMDHIRQISRMGTEFSRFYRDIAGKLSNFLSQGRKSGVLIAQPGTFNFNEIAQNMQIADGLIESDETAADGFELVQQGGKDGYAFSGQIVLLMDLIENGLKPVHVLLHFIAGQTCGHLGGQVGQAFGSKIKILKLFSKLDEFTFRTCGHFMQYLVGALQAVPP